MNCDKYDELEHRSADSLLRQAELLDEIKRLEAHTRVRDVITEMKEEGKALELTDEEERLLRSFRRFKAICKAGAVFKWQTRPIEGVTITPETAPVMIQDPQDVSGR